MPALIKSSAVLELSSHPPSHPEGTSRTYPAWRTRAASPPPPASQATFPFPPCFHLALLLFYFPKAYRFASQLPCACLPCSLSLPSLLRSRLRPQSLPRQPAAAALAPLIPMTFLHKRASPMGSHGISVTGRGRDLPMIPPLGSSFPLPPSPRITERKTLQGKQGGGLRG